MEKRIHVNIIFCWSTKLLNDVKKQKSEKPMKNIDNILQRARKAFLS